MSPKDQYPNALEVIRQITNLTQGEDCIYRGESAISFEYPCSSTLYRQLRKENATPGSIPECLKRRQDERIKASRKYKDMGDNDLERLMSLRHLRVKLNLLDFTKNHLVALFFVCFEQDKHGENGLIVVKREGEFRTLETEKNKLPDKETVLLEPHENLQRARDQHGVFLHAPGGRVLLKPDEAILIKSENKQEILSFLEKANISDATMFRDAFGDIERWDREDEERVAMATQSTTESTPNLQGFAKSNDNRNILIMESYMRLLIMASKEGLYSELLNDKSEILIARLTDAIDRDTQDAVAYYNRAVVHQSKPSPDYDQAISDYTRTIELNIKFAEAYNNRGLAYIEKPQPDYAKAISDFSSALVANPKFAEAYSNRGAAYATQSPPDYAKAMKDYSDAIKLNPNLAETHYNQGIAYTKKLPPNFDQAIESYDQAIARNPKYFQAYLNRGIAHFSKPIPDHAQAILDFSYAIDLKSGYAMAYNNRGNVYANKQFPDYDQAIKDYDYAIELNREYSEAYLNRGLSHFLKTPPDYTQAIADINRAISDFSRVIGLDYKLARAYYARANVHAVRDDCLKACDDYAKAIKGDPKLESQPLIPELKKCLESHNRKN